MSNTSNHLELFLDTKQGSTSATTTVIKSSPLELVDLRVDLWGNTYNSAGARFRNSEKLLDMLQHMAFPTFDQEDWSPARVYKSFTFVHDSKENSFVSIQDVPSGVDLSDPNYWVRWEVKDAITQAMKINLEELEKELDKLDRLKANSSDLTNQFNFKGNCLYKELPTTGNSLNDTYFVTDKGFRYSWNGNNWFQSSSAEELGNVLVMVDGCLCFRYQE